MERSKKVVFVSHCILNQNARALGRERAPGAVKELLELFSEAGVGIVQIPCPQVEYNGGVNRRSNSRSCKEKAYKGFCKKLSSSILKQVEKYLKNNYDVLGILGVELSATCAVHQIENGSKNAPGKGVLIEQIEEAMHKKNFQVPLIGIDLNNVFSSMRKVQSLVKYSS